MTAVVLTAAAAHGQAQTPSTRDRIGAPGDLQLQRRPAELRIVGVGRPEGISARAGSPFDITVNDVAVVLGLPVILYTDTRAGYADVYLWR
jgi:hypothetical protein